jgi:hypothetical protein
VTLIVDREDFRARKVIMDKDRNYIEFRADSKSRTILS